MAMTINWQQLEKLRKMGTGRRGPAEEFSFDTLAKAFPERIKILAEGDSWFAYPRQFLLFGAANNVIDWLKKGYKDKLLVKDIASNGDEAVGMLSGEAKLELLERLTKSFFDLLLFSGGGNDIVGRFDFEYFLLPKTSPDQSWQDCIHMERFERRLTMIKLAYLDLVELTRQYSKNPEIQIITHTYDLAIPDPRGASFLGGMLDIDDGQSWMHPYLLLKGIEDRKDQEAIVSFLLTRFKDEMVSLEEATGGVLKVVNTHGIIARDEWLNEIHPNSKGFEKIANHIYKEGICRAMDC